MTLTTLQKQWSLTAIILISGLCPLILAQEVKPSEKPDPLLVPSLAKLKQRIKSELRVTRPDYVVFVPQVTDTEVSDTGNEHFLIFDGAHITITGDKPSAPCTFTAKVAASPTGQRCPLDLAQRAAGTRVFRRAFQLWGSQ